MYPVKYVACYEYELMWLFAGIVAGYILATLIRRVMDGITRNKACE